MPYKPDDYTVVDHRVSSKEGTNTFQRMMFLIVIFEHKNLVLYILIKQQMFSIFTWRLVLREYMWPGLK